MGRFSAKVHADLLWVKNNAEGTVALVLAVTMSVLGIVDLIPADLVSKVIPLTLGVVSFAMLRDRWRQETAAGVMHDAIVETAGSLNRLNDRFDRVSAMDGLLTSTQQTLDGLAEVRFAAGAELTEALAQARKNTDYWYFKGGTGAHTRVVTLPDCCQQAADRGRSLHVRMEILDPADIEACKRYARLYRSLADGADDDALTWDVRGTQIELYSTILAACWYKQRRDHILDIEIALTSSVSIFRFDLSSSCLIVTHQGPRFPAMIFEKGRTFYHSWDIELRASFSECRRVRLERAHDISLTPEPCVEAARRLFRCLELDLPEDYTDNDVETIIEKALRDRNRSQRGAGDDARPDRHRGTRRPGGAATPAEQPVG
ncbi:hypothetical protein [Nocardia mexicana]|uniref:Uncharacterized protein n=1 Tax=Nocardia mexicana TaxID=279262 RepID=A0A370GSM4_9NOCA|nr:hypothetical protein [Nocardia mexicana]RDI44933.1 hypothetical protein DFR68_11585 [Nocardia mexicana]